MVALLDQNLLLQEMLVAKTVKPEKDMLDAKPGTVTYKPMLIATPRTLQGDERPGNPKPNLQRMWLRNQNHKEMLVEERKHQKDMGCWFRNLNPCMLVEQPQEENAGCS